MASIRLPLVYWISANRGPTLSAKPPIYPLRLRTNTQGSGKKEVWNCRLGLHIVDRPTNLLALAACAFAIIGVHLFTRQNSASA